MFIVRLRMKEKVAVIELLEILYYSPVIFADLCLIVNVHPQPLNVLHKIHDGSASTFKTTFCITLCYLCFASCPFTFRLNSMCIDLIVYYPVQLIESISSRIGRRWRRRGKQCESIQHHDNMIRIIEAIMASLIFLTHQNPNDHL